ncbi:hypothetical protein SNL152K_8680 [Streptomyces sp. NL15-2K]|nr:hypothetical protein SNL152K_8680 [Streptomyces sp. NL15-2K]
MVAGHVRDDGGAGRWRNAGGRSVTGRDTGRTPRRATGP